MWAIEHHEVCVLGPMEIQEGEKDVYVEFAIWNIPLEWTKVLEKRQFGP